MAEPYLEKYYVMDKINQSSPNESKIKNKKFLKLSFQFTVPTKVLRNPLLSPLSVRDEETPKSANKTEPSSSTSKFPALTSLYLFIFF